MKMKKMQEKGRKGKVVKANEKARKKKHTGERKGTKNKRREMRREGKGVSPAIFKNVFTVLKAIAVIIAVMAGIYGLSNFIDSRIEQAINNEQFIKKVTAYIRPFVIFDANATVYADMGAMQHLEKIEIAPSSSGLGFEIVVTPKTHLVYPPILEQLETPGEPAITPMMFPVPKEEGKKITLLMLENLLKGLKEVRISKRYEVQIMRGKGFSWVFKIKASLRPEEVARWRFRLEVLR